MRGLFILSFLIALSACTDTYHPEYHPVTVSNFSQNIAYPVNVQSGMPAPSSATPGVVIVREPARQ